MPRVPNQLVLLLLLLPLLDRLWNAWRGRKERGKSA